MVTIGVLGLQGAIKEHVKAVEATGAQGLVVKTYEQLAEIDGLIMPGGESTTMRRLIDRYQFFEPLRAFAADGKPIFGTCAGMILLAGQIQNQTNTHLALMDITVARNAYGRQKDSFETPLAIQGVGRDYPAVFIRAPYMTDVGSEVQVLAAYDDTIVTARQGHLLACSFHPELTEDIRLHQYFTDMVNEAL